MGIARNKASIGSSFENFLREEGIRKEAQATAIKRLRVMRKGRQDRQSDLKKPTETEAEAITDFRDAARVAAAASLSDSLQKRLSVSRWLCR